jgi:hypothetical protein
MRFGLAASSRVAIGLLAFVGVLSAHWLAYFLSAPAQLEREHLLSSTGHGDWSLAGALAIGAFTAAFASTAWGRLRRDDPRPSTTTIAWRLTRLQILGFVALEAAERAAAGESVIDALTEPVVALGVLVQIVVALAGALVTRLVTEVVDRLVFGRTPGPKRAPRRAGYRGAGVGPLRPTRLDSGAGTLRGPPSMLAST